MAQKARNIKLFWIFSVILILMVIVFILFYPYRYVLYLQEPATEKIIAYLPVTERDHFQIKYTHSVHLSDVYEEFEMKNEYMYPVQLIYEDTAIGMPSNAEKGETFQMKDGKYYITNLQGRHQSITLAVGKVRANHAILYHDTHHYLEEHTGAGPFVKIAAEHLPNWKLIRGVNMNE